MNYWHIGKSAFIVLFVGRPINYVTVYVKQSIYCLMLLRVILLFLFCYYV